MESQEMIEYSEENGVFVCLLPANLDTAACNTVGEELLARIKRANQPVVFDMQRVEFVASAFLSLCLTSSRCAAGGNFRIRNVKPMVRKVLDVTGLSRRFVIE